MKRVLCAAVLAVAAVSAPAAAAGPDSPITLWNDGDRVGAGTGTPDQSLLSVYVDRDRDEACAGFGRQVPQCMPLHSS